MRVIPSILVVVAMLTRSAVAEPTAVSRLESATDRGLAFLARQQRPDGSFESGPAVAVTSLATLAYLSAGHVPDDGKFGLVLRKAADWLVAQTPEDGDIGKLDESFMYGQAIATAAVAEIYAVENDDARRRNEYAALTHLVKAMRGAQLVAKPEKFTGGWDDKPADVESNLAVTAWCAMALRAAGRAGVPIDDAMRRDVVGFVMKCRDPHAGGFAYRPDEKPQTAMTAAGVAALAWLDASENAAFSAGVQSLIERRFDEAPKHPSFTRFFLTRAATGRPVPVAAAAVEAVLQSQEADGGWPVSVSPMEPGRTYATAMAVLTLTERRSDLIVDRR